MSIASEITRLQTAKANIKNALAAKCVEVDSASTIDTYSSYFDDICTGEQLDYTPVGYDSSDKASADTAFQQLILEYPATLTGQTAFTDDSQLEFAPYVDLNGVEDIANMFSGCTRLQYVPDYDYSTVLRMGHMFDSCYYLKTAPIVNAPNSIGRPYMYYNSGIKTVPSGFTINNSTKIQYMFAGCDSLTNVAPFDTSSADNMGRLFSGCANLTAIPDLDLSSCLNIIEMWAGCTSLQSIGRLSNCENITGTTAPFGSTQLDNLTDMGGLYGLKVSWTKNTFGKAPNLTVQSLVNIIDGLYDFTGNGETPGSNQGTLKLGALNYAKLTEDQIAVGTAKGWSIIA